MEAVAFFLKGFQRVDIAGDTYRNASINAGERENRGRSDKVIIKSTKSKVPKAFQAFLRNGENRNRKIANISHLFFKRGQLCTSESIGSNNCG